MARLKKLADFLTSGFTAGELKQLVSTLEGGLVTAIHWEYAVADVAFEVAEKLESRGLLKSTRFWEQLEATRPRRDDEIASLRSQWVPAGDAQHAKFEGPAVPHDDEVGQFELVLSGTVEEYYRPRVEALMAHLRAFLKEPQLTLVRVSKGSVRLVLEGTWRAFKQLRHPEKLQDADVLCVRWLGTRRQLNEQRRAFLRVLKVRLSDLSDQQFLRAFMQHAAG